MLDASYTEKENAIEEIVYNSLKDKNFSELSEEDADFFISVSLLSKRFRPLEKDKFPLFQIIERRVEHCFTFKFIDQRAILILCAWTKTAGNAILYLWYIQGWCFKNNVREVDLETLSTRIFPRGIFSEDTLKSVWIKQKVRKNELEQNLIDYNVAGSSIQYNL